MAVYLRGGVDNPHDNLVAMSQGAYTTEAEEKAKKAVIAYNYSGKLGLAIIAAISILALSIVLGTVVQPSASTVIIAIVIPTGLGFWFRTQHRTLDRLHQIEYDRCMDILQIVAGYVKTRREQKLNYVFNKATIISEDGVKDCEKTYDEQNKYEEFANLTIDAKNLILRHYTIPYSGYSDGNALNKFVKACCHVSGATYHYGSDDSRTFIAKEAKYSSRYVLKSIPSGLCSSTGTSVLALDY